ncbi:MAG: O-antigen ligase C-terminal domain-containing protein [Rhodoferax sp.]|nr:O-antigen ligase C-terminal domain-containing protein [Rhodoferax sp.]
MNESMRVPSLPVMSRFWLTAWSATLSLGWLLPNHYLPWTAFHFDVWIAFVVALAGAAVIVRAPDRFPWFDAALLTSVLVVLAWLQQAAGMIGFIGTTWISSAFLLGLLLALLIGAQWESATAGQLGDGLFLAIGLAALVSVGMQLQQWLGLDGLDELEVWIMRDNFGRPFANFGQPNQLATFLLWGLLALGWAWVRRLVAGPVAILGALYLLFGLAMTNSRTGWLATMLLLSAVWYWRGHWPSARLPWVATALVAFFFLCTASLGGLREVLLLAEHRDLLDPMRLSTETRPAIWALFADAAWQRPWWGYGWNQTLLAQLEVAADRTRIGAFSYAHNLFLDLVLWMGIPMGLAVALGVVVWMWRTVRKVRNAEDVLLVLFLLVVANHAMLELPLHYAYMLLPAGLVAGMLDVRAGATPRLRTGRLVPAGLWLLACALLGLIISDYASVEPAYRNQRFVQANIRTPPSEPLDLLLLTQLQAHLRMTQFEPDDHMSEADLDWMRRTVAFNPAPASFQKVAAAMAWNGHPEEAGLWLRRMCKVVSEVQCDIVRRSWDRMASSDPRIAAVPWPK